MPKNAFYAQSGGVTSVINASAAALILEARKHYDNVYAGHNGILGALEEKLIDTSVLTESELAKISQTPGGYFGSCRYKLKSLEENRAEYERLIEVFAAHDIKAFFYNGGGDSQDTCKKVSTLARELGVELTAIGVPKTIDNDLPFTDNCPGFASVAKYVATSILEASLDIASMAKTSTKVFIMEVMGRHTGWIAASAALAQRLGGAPHIILLPEVTFEPEKFIAKVKATVDEHGYCVICASEGIQNAAGEFLSASGNDAFGHAQLGGVAPRLAEMVKSELGLKYHWAVSDYLQRSARHIASTVDVEHAQALAKTAVELAVAGKHGVMPYINRVQASPYKWTVETASLDDVANVERFVPPEFITKDGFGVTDACLEYLRPLIQGEAYPTYNGGLPDYAIGEHKFVEQKCKVWTAV